MDNNTHMNLPAWVKIGERFMLHTASVWTIRGIIDEHIVARTEWDHYSVFPAEQMARATWISD